MSWNPSAAGDGLEAGFGTAAIGPPWPPLLVRQVHGPAVVSLDEARGGPEADAIVVDRPGQLVAVATADCLPLLLVAEQTAGRWAAAVHAGWRGILAGVIGGALGEASAAGIAADRLCAALGPSIGPCCYRVGPELVRAFQAAGLGRAVEDSGEHLDLGRAAQHLLAEAGLGQDLIELSGVCTRCGPGLYYSHRGGAKPGQRQLSWIGWWPERDGSRGSQG